MGELVYVQKRENFANKKKSHNINQNLKRAQLSGKKFYLEVYFKEMIMDQCKDGATGVKLEIG